MALIEEFKARMHIFHSIEDTNLQRILDSSTAAISRMTGMDSKTDNLEFQELVLERSRYVYNDQVEFFEQNFQSQILGLSASTLTDDGSSESGDTDDGS